ncbi:deoxyribodipyrimidine photo-lyase [Candidatus Roizmanbacteria bacterium]|nr:MAG: deoxyribodipyrimidine photo-lyase [Candidatus Roizmanbacteria bacterium]
MIQKERIRKLNTQTTSSGSAIAYWMSRDQRVSENWALLYAQELSKKNNLPLVVFFVLTPNFPGATLRHYDFMLKGLKEIDTSLKKLYIPFILQIGDPIEEIPKLTFRYDVKELVTDFSPLRIGREWRTSIARNTTIPFYEVDAHNIVPVWEASPRQEFAARTIRPKIQKKLKQFLTAFPNVGKNIPHSISLHNTEWEGVTNKLSCNREVKAVTWLNPGEKAAKHMMKEFIETRLRGYGEKSNNPNLNAQSNLSPYLHFGQISAQYISLNIQQSIAPNEDKEAFLEELIIRRELADNYCNYNSEYDSYRGFPDWSKKSLNEHLKDRREYVYTLKEFEQGKTHDEIWNKAQIEMVDKGKMHGYMRMYWAKKILEWTKTAQEAMEIAVYLNDKYELDGRDPNGYVGCAWSIGGVHDRPWFERSIYGKIRYMNANGLKRKFDVDQYLSQV